MAKSAGVRLRGRFAPGTKVQLVPAAGDTFAVGGPVHKEATVDKNGEVSFDGLEEGSRWFVAGEVDGRIRSAAVTAKDQSQQQKAAPAWEAGKFNQQLISQPQTEVIEGPRGTAAIRDMMTGQISEFAGVSVGKPQDLPKGEVEPQPHLRQEDVGDKVQQRSATLTGQATPVDPEEVQPKPKQEDVPAKQPQRSATETGEATPVSPDEVQPAIKQEDAPKGLQQRSDTESGNIEPIPQGKPVEVEQRRDDSAERAEGHTPEKPREKVDPGAVKGKKRSASRKSSSKKAGK